MDIKNSVPTRLLAAEKIRGCFRDIEKRPIWAAYKLYVFNYRA